MTATPQIFRVLGHARTMKCTGRSGRQNLYRAACECGWQDKRDRSSRRIAKDFHVAHLQDAGRREPKRVLADAARPFVAMRKMPEVGETWTMTSASKRARVVTAVDPPHYKQTAAQVMLHDADDPRVTHRITLASMLKGYAFTSAAPAFKTTAAPSAATCSGVTC
jgi:hypothetical protein